MSLWAGEIRLHLVSPERFSPKGWFNEVLGILEAAPRFAPDSFAWSARKPAGYDRAAALRQGRAALKTGNALVLSRRAAAAHQTHAMFLVGFQTHLVMVLAAAPRPEGELDALFSMSDQLVEAMRADLGVLQPMTGNPATRAHDRAGYYRPQPLAQAGLVAPAARTWFGPRVVELVGAPALAEIGATAGPGSAMTLDLVPHPWTADLATLTAARGPVENALRAKGLLAREIGATAAEPGPAWVPLPPQSGPA